MALHILLHGFYIWNNVQTGSLPLINSTPNESPGHNVTIELPDNGHVTRYIIPGTTSIYTV